MRNFNLPWLGGGAGLRHQHFQEIISGKPAFPWFEIIVDDFVDIGGYVRECFEEIRKSYRIVPHGVGMSIGSTDPLDMKYLTGVKQFLDRIEAPWYSDHLCFTMVDHINLESLVPVPFTKEAVTHISKRVRFVQNYLERPFLLENVTRYITVSDREMSEAEFIGSILEEADCGLLLDVTNVTLNAKYHNFDPLEFLKALPLERVGQVHLAGWEGEGDDVIDSHDAPVPPQVWELFQELLKRTGPTSAIVEWDKSIPPVAQLLQEALTADKLIREFA